MDPQPLDDAVVPAPPPPRPRRHWGRILRTLIGFVFTVVTAAALAGAVALYLAASGRNLPLLRAAVGAVGRAVAGQRTEALRARLQLVPATRRLSGEATLTMRADGAERRRFFFLLNDGLQLRATWQEAPDGARTPLPTMRLGPLAVVELPEPLAVDAETQLGFAYDGVLRAAITGSGAVLESDDVIVTPADFWYPADAQGAFTADVELLLPADLTLVHNGRETSRVVEGTSARVRFVSERPVAGLALVAGRYAAHEREVDGRRYRLLLPADIALDPARVLANMAVAQRGLVAHYGPSGFPQSTLYVPRRLRRAFNDGSGLLAIPPRYFADGRYGFETVAHELAHDWWGATVAERWLSPGTGGEWLVEGFAEFSAWRAVGEHFGEAALVRARLRGSFDPEATRALAEMSVLDNGLDTQARATIYAKGGTVASLLAQQLGDGPFDTAARALLDRYRYQSAGDAEIEAVFAESSGQDLKPFFATWVRSTAALDLALEPQDGAAVVRNLREAPPPAALTLWRTEPSGAVAPETTALGARVQVGDATRLVLDPLAATADMFRANNVLPRSNPPRALETSSRGELLLVEGQPVPWEPATVSILSPAGAQLHTWAINRGLASDPQWSADGTRILAVESPRAGEAALVALLGGDGRRQPLGRDAIAAGDADGTVVARGGRLLRLAGGRTRLLVSHADGRIVAPLPAPSGGAIAYALVRDAGMELRLLPAGASDSRVLFTWAASPPRWRWAPDGTRLFVVLPGDWDWHLWELATDGSAPRRLVLEAARITDLSVAADGHRVALVAQAEVDEPNDRSEVFVIDDRGSEVRRFGWPQQTVIDAAWLDDQSLAVITANAGDPAIPQARLLQRLSLSDGALSSW